MNKIYQEKLERLAVDELMLGAINEMFNDAIESARPIISDSDSNELLGQKFRAYEEAKIILAKTMDKIHEYENIKENNNDFNKSK